MFEQIVIIAGWVVCTMLALGVALLVITSIHEQRWRAAAIGFILGAPMIAGAIGVLTWDAPLREWVVFALVIAALAVTLLLTLPIGTATPTRIMSEQRRIDEREAVFHRFIRLEPGTPEWEAYYAENPEKEAFDAEVRKLPGLTKPGHATYHALASNFVNAAPSTCSKA